MSTTPTVRTLVCVNEHTTEVQPWCANVPSVCAFAPCSQRFLASHELARLTREANARTKAAAEATIRPVPTFDADGWLIDLTPAPKCENPF